MTSVPNVQEIIKLSGVHPLKVRNLYVYGSRVYGYARRSSDYDIVMVAPGLIGKETKNEIYNVHQVMPDRFADEIENYNVRAMECIFAPDWAKLQEKQNYEIKIVPAKLVSSFLTQSHDMWNHAKHKFHENDILRANKSGFHSLKTLVLGIDIVKNNRITDFRVVKTMHEDFESYFFTEWDDMKSTYFSYKKNLEQTIKSLI